MALLIFGVPGPGYAQELDRSPWGTDGNITGIVRSGNTIYIAGAFSLVGPNTGSFVSIDRSTGAVLPLFPKVAGVVKTVVPDGSGGWFLGGWFVGVGDLPRSGLAQILADGTVSDWNPGQDGYVEALALKGSTLYVGGSFTRIGGTTRNSIAAINVETGHATSWQASADGPVRALLAADSTLYAGGDFAQISGQPRRGVAELSLESGSATSWNPDVEVGGFPGEILALAQHGGLLYLGGLFSQVGGQPRRNLAAIDVRTGHVTDWNPDANSCNCNSYDGSPYVTELVPGQGTIYVAGHFSTIGGLDRAGLAEVDLLTGMPTSWDPHLGPQFEDYASLVVSLALTEQTIYVSGSFYSIGGHERNFIAEVDRLTGTATDWNPNANAWSEALVVSGDKVYAGGRFTTLGLWQKRRNLAALNATTGELTDWNPDPDGLIVFDLAVSHGKVYVGGHFSRIGGQDRWFLAALDTIKGAATDWVANTDESAQTLEVTGDRLFAGGYFTTINAIPRTYVASFDLETDELTDWNPSPNHYVFGIGARGDNVFLGGDFSSVGGTPQRYLAAVDATTGTLVDWDPNPDQWVNTIAVMENTVVVGGAFQDIDGQPRSCLAALDATTGRVKDWAADIANVNPNFARVYDLEILGATVYVGGSFDSVGGKPRGGLAALDSKTGRVLDWDPALGGPTSDYPLESAVVWSLASSGTTVYAGGRFRWSGSVPVTTLAALSGVPDDGGSPSPDPAVPTLASIPNPTRSNATIRFFLPSTAPVSLAVYDVRGRRIASLLDQQSRSAGFHEVPVHTAGWPAGFYFCRLETEGATATGKLVVLK